MSRVTNAGPAEICATSRPPAIPLAGVLVSLAVGEPAGAMAQPDQLPTTDERQHRWRLPALGVFPQFGLRGAPGCAPVLAKLAFSS